MSGIPAGWQPDPTGRHQVRYWDGTAWSEHVATNGVAAIDPPTLGGPIAAFSQFGAPPGMQPAREKATPGLAFGAIAPGILLIIGSFLEVASFQRFYAIKFIDGDGKLTLAAGIAVAVLAGLLGAGVLPRWGGFLVAAAGIAGAMIAGLNVADVADSGLDFGPALFICLAGGLIAALLGILAGTIKHRPQPHHTGSLT